MSLKLFVGSLLVFSFVRVLAQDSAQKPVPQSEKMRQQRKQLEKQTEEKVLQAIERKRLQTEAQQSQKFQSNSQSFGRNVVRAEDLNQPDSQMYVTVGGGTLMFPATDFVEGFNGSFVTSLGIYLGSDLWLEPQFLYSFQQADFNVTEDIDHFGLGTSLQYDFGYSNEAVTPRVGVGLYYTRRSINAGERASNAFDGCLLAGLDVALTNSFKLGLDTRYFVNIDYGNEFASNRALQFQDFAIEDTNYWALLFNGKFLF